MKKPKTRKGAARKPKSDPKPKKPSKAAAARAAVGHNSMDPALRTLFLTHNDQIAAKLAQVTKFTGQLRALYKAAKGDGFTKAMFDVARQVATPEGEAEYKGKLARQLEAARYVGAEIGLQLELLGTPEDAKERAYNEGQKASIENKAAVPDYAPGTELYELYMKGFHDHQSGIAESFKKPQEPEKGAKGGRGGRKGANASANGQKPGEDAPAQPEPKPAPPAPEPPPPPPAAAPEPTSGQPMSRAEYNRLNPAESESQFSRRQ